MMKRLLITLGLTLKLARVISYDHRIVAQD
jgi:hypothetical protein